MGRVRERHELSDGRKPKKKDTKTSEKKPWRRFLPAVQMMPMPCVWTIEDVREGRTTFYLCKMQEM
jgi:hypothetical protein